MTNNIKLKINSRYKLSLERSGVHRYASFLAKSLEKFEGINIEEITPPKFLSNGILGHFWEQLILPLKLKNTDVLLSPCNFGPILKRKQIVILHDALVIDQKHLFKKFYRIWAKLFLHIIVVGGKRVVTVSSKSQQDLRNHFNNHKSNFEIIGMGVEPLSPKSKIGDFALSTSLDKYFLFVGGHIKRKNLNFLIDLWNQFDSEENIRLIVTFGNNNRSTQNTQIRFRSNIDFRFVPNDRELGDLYRGCQALLWPSLAEGFGMPLLEVMSYGRPFLANNVGAASELAIGGSKVLPLVNEIWADEIRILQSKDNAPIARIINESNKYSWNNVAKNIEKICKEISI